MFEQKVQAFTHALDLFQRYTSYARFEVLLSCLIIAFQIISVYQLIATYVFSGFIPLFITLCATYYATDFFNGIAHMIIDNNTRYDSFAGPFIAAFHLHHATLRYKETNPFKIYFYESGHKFWLVIYLALLLIGQKVFYFNSNLNLFFVLFGVLSSVAEVSHFLCHNSSHKGGVKFLQKCKLLLSFSHHRQHHTKDNTHYAFLNGMSDPLLNWIALRYYSGYKNHSDLHVAEYFKRVCTK